MIHQCYTFETTVGRYQKFKISHFVFQGVAGFMVAEREQCFIIQNVQMNLPIPTENAENENEDKMDDTENEVVR